MTTRTRRLLLALAMIITSSLVLLGSAQPAAAECKPPEIPDRAGTGLPGQIDDQAASNQPESLYGAYGWAGLTWTTCELDGFAGLPSAESAMVSAKTQIGNAGLGVASFLGALITQLGEWAIDPGELMSPIDEVIGDVTEAVVGATWTPYAAVVIILAAIGIILNSLRGEVRAAIRTATAVLIACFAIAWVTTPVNGEPGAVHAAATFDDLATKVNGDVMNSLNQYVGTEGNSNDEVVGATMHDKLIYKLWALGALGSQESADEYGEDLYRTAAVGWAAVNDEEEVDAEERRNEYDELVQQIKEEDPRAYDAIRGVGSSRVGMGALAAVDLFLIALVRVPAEVLMLAGLLLLRAFVMFTPILALLAVVPATRGIAWSAAKATLVALANVIIYGAITAIHTVAVGALSTHAGTLGILTGGLVVLTVVCIAIMMALAVKSAQKSKEYMKETATNVAEAPQRFYDDVTQTSTAIPETVAGTVKDPFDRRQNADDPEGSGSGTHVHVAVRDELLPPPTPEEADDRHGNRRRRHEDSDDDREQSDAEWRPGYDNSEELRRALAVDVDVDTPGGTGADTDGDGMPDSRASEWADYYLATEDGSSPAEHYLAPADGGSVTDHYLSAEDDSGGGGADRNGQEPAPTPPTAQDVNVTVDTRSDANQRIDVTVDQEPNAAAGGMENREPPPPPNPPMSYNFNDDDDTFHVPDDDGDSSGGGGDQTIMINNRDQIHVSVQSYGSSGGGDGMQSEELDADGNLAPVIFRPDEEEANSGEMAGAGR